MSYLIEYALGYTFFSMKFIVSFFLLFVFDTALFAQNIGIGTTSPKATALLDVQANNKGVLIPRLTTSQRNAIANPERSLLVFDTDKGTIFFYDGTAWKGVSFTAENNVPPITRLAIDTKANTSFGNQVDIAGDYAIIGAKLWSTNAMPNRGAAYIFYKGTNGWLQQAKLTPPDSTANDYFGASVAIKGDYAIVGAPTKANGRGKIYLYKRTGTAWNLEANFTKPGAVTDYDNFGFSVEMCINGAGLPIAIIGTPFTNVGGTDKGEITTFTRNIATGIWAFGQTIVPTDIANNDNYGFSIAADGNYLVVGAPYQNGTAGTDAGAAYVYLFSGSTYSQQTKLIGATAGASFGISVAINGNLIAAAAPYAALYANTSPAVYTYKRSNTTWDNTNIIYLSNITSSNLTSVYGVSVAIQNNKLLIGAPGGIDYANGGNITYTPIKGAVYMYDNYGTDLFNTTTVKIVYSENSFNGDYFGQSISVDGTSGNFIISDHKQQLNGNIFTGAVMFGTF